VDALYQLWNRNPIEVRATYLASSGKTDRPPATVAASY